MLSNPMNRNGWPDVVSKEVTENLHKFIANGKFAVTHSKLTRQTLTLICHVIAQSAAYSDILFDTAAAA